MKVDDGLREFIASKIMRGILKATPVIFGSIKESIIKLMEDCLRSFRSEWAFSQLGSHRQSFKEFRGSGKSDFHGVKDPHRSQEMDCRHRVCTVDELLP